MADEKTTPKRGPTPKKHEPRGGRRKLIGKVVSDTGNKGRAKKTIVVEVTRFFRDPVYGKYVKRRRKFLAHDEKEQYQTNDMVEIAESRPLSATKRWEAVRLVDRPVEV